MSPQSPLLPPNADMQDREVVLVTGGILFGVRQAKPVAAAGAKA